MPDLRWENPRRGEWIAYGPSGAKLAMVSHVLGPGGRDDGWVAWIVGHDDSLRGFTTAEQARAAVEAELRRRPV